MNMDREVNITQKVIKALKERIEYLKDNDPDNPNLDKLKLLLSDNVSEEGKIHIRFSLMNKQAHLYFSNYTDYLYRYQKEHLYN